DPIEIAEPSLNPSFKITLSDAPRYLADAHGMLRAASTSSSVHLRSSNFRASFREAPYIKGSLLSFAFMQGSFSIAAFGCALLHRRYPRHASANRILDGRVGFERSLRGDLGSSLSHLYNPQLSNNSRNIITLRKDTCRWTSPLPHHLRMRFHWYRCMDRKGSLRHSPFSLNFPAQMPISTSARSSAKKSPLRSRSLAARRKI